MLSTGVIGARLPLDKVLAGARAAAGELSAEVAMPPQPRS